MTSYTLSASPTVVDDLASASIAIENTGAVPILAQPLGRQIGAGETLTVPGWSAVSTTLQTDGRPGSASVTLTSGSPAARPGPGGVTLNPAGIGSMAVTITGGTWYSDEGLTTAVSWPLTVATSTVVYPAAEATVTIAGTAGSLTKTLGVRVTAAAKTAFRLADYISGPSDSAAGVAAAQAAAMALKAPLASPALTGDPTMPTASPGDHDTSGATTAFVSAAVAAEATARDAAIAAQHVVDTGTYATISSLSSYGHILGEAHSSATVVNTASEGTLATFAIPTNASIGDVYNFVASGDLLNNSGSPVTYQWKFSIGSTAALLGQANSISSSAQRRRWVFRACIRVTGASTQNVSGELFISTAMSASFSDGSISAIGSGSSSEDLSTEKQAKFSVIMGTASASADVVCAGAHLVMPGKAI